MMQRLSRETRALSAAAGRVLALERRLDTSAYQLFDLALSDGIGGSCGLAKPNSKDQAMVVQGDGRIVVAGNVNPTNVAFAHRFLPLGSNCSSDSQYDMQILNFGGTAPSPSPASVRMVLSPTPSTKLLVGSVPGGGHASFYQGI